MSELTLTKPYRRSDGHLGARAALLINRDDGRSQTYCFDTHGMTSAQVVEKAATIEAYHGKKAGRLNGFRSISGVEINGYCIVDCSIHDNGVTLYLDVRPKVSGFPIRKAYGNVDAIPSDEEIVAMVTAALPNSTDEIQKAHDAFVAKVNAKRGE